MALACTSAYNRLPWNDEGALASPALNLAQHGFMGTTVIEPASTSGNGFPLLRINERTYWVFPGQLVAQAFWYLFVPPTIFLTRLFYILFIPAALGAFYYLVRYISADFTVASLATALFGLDFIFYSGAGFARPEMMCLTFGLGGLAAYLALRARNFVLAAFVSHLMIAISIITHPNGVLHLAGLLILMFYYDRRRILNWRHFAVAAAAYSIVITPWFFYIAKDVEAFRVQLAQNAVSHERMASTLNPFRLVWLEIKERYLYTMGFTSPRMAARLKAVSLLSFAFAAIAALLLKTWRRIPSVKLFLVLLGTYFAIQCVFNQKVPYYMVHILPLYCAVFACFIAGELRSARIPRFVLWGWVAIIVTTQFALAAGTAARSYRPNERELIHFVNTHMQTAKLIWGSDALAFAMHFDPRLLDDAYLGIRSKKTADAIIVTPLYNIVFDVYRTERPDDWRKISAQLARYHLVYENPDYKVYFSPDQIASNQIRPIQPGNSQ